MSGSMLRKRMLGARTPASSAARSALRWQSQSSSSSAAGGAGGGEQAVGQLELAAAGAAGKGLPADDARGRELDDRLEAGLDGTLREDVGELVRACARARAAARVLPGDEHLGSDRREHGGTTFAAEPRFLAWRFSCRERRKRAESGARALARVRTHQSAGSGDAAATRVPVDRAGDQRVPAERAAEDVARGARRGEQRARGRCPSRCPSRAASRRGPRSRCCRSRPAGTGQPPSSPKIDSKLAHAGLERREHVRQALAARVVEVRGELDAGRRARSRAAAKNARTCRGLAMPVVSPKPISCAPRRDQPLRRSRTRAPGRRGPRRGSRTTTEMTPSQRSPAPRGARRAPPRGPSATPRPSG